MQLTQRHREYWRRTVRLTMLLLALWFVVTFVAMFFARELSAFHFFGWPVSFYIAAQGAPIVYVLVVWWYARRMRRLDREYDVAEEDA